MRANQDLLVKKMLEPCFYNHPVTKVELVETHISRIFLAGEFAYKLKKPVDFGFLDFSTLERRQHFCQEELRLNRRFSPQLYLDVCRVGGRPDDLHLGGEPAIDFLVKMRRFPAEAQLDRMLEAGLLTSAHLEACALRIAEFHRRAAIASPESSYGSPSVVTAPVLENFTQLAPILPDSHSASLFRLLEEWSRHACEQLQDRFEQRKRQGFIRECHGDLHLANMLWQDEQPVLFDCIEFNANLRWIDQLNEIAFLVMDLDDRGKSPLGWAFLNAYLQQTGDYRDLDLLTFYKVYRALVRAKVTCLRLGQAGLAVKEKKTDRQLAHNYLELAATYIKPHRPQLLICHGLSGSGKTSFITRLAPACRAIRIHSDRERKRLAGLEGSDTSHSRPDGGIYTGSATDATYSHLLKLAEAILGAGISVVVDATFLLRRQRGEFHQLAKRVEVPFRILDFPLPEAILRERIYRRRQQSGRLSEATEEILDLQLTRQERLTEEETGCSFRIQPNTAIDKISETIRLGP